MSGGRATSASASFTFFDSTAASSFVVPLRAQVFRGERSGDLEFFQLRAGLFVERDRLGRGDDGTQGRAVEVHVRHRWPRRRGPSRARGSCVPSSSSAMRSIVVASMVGRPCAVAFLFCSATAARTDGMPPRSSCSATGSCSGESVASKRVAVRRRHRRLDGTARDARVAADARRVWVDRVRGARAGRSPTWRHDASRSTGVARRTLRALRTGRRRSRSRIPRLSSQLLSATAGAALATSWTRIRDGRGRPLDDSDRRRVACRRLAT